MRIIKSFIFILIAGLITACSVPQDGSEMTVSGDAFRILGGHEVQDQDPDQKYVVMIYGEDAAGTSFTCTGTFISDSTILTAGHCIAKETQHISVFFGVKPFASAETVSIDVVSATVHPNFYAANLKERVDLGLIYFKGGLPTGARRAELMILNAKMTAIKSLKLLGYGQETDQDSMLNSEHESGILRAVEIRTSKIQEKDGLFELDQSSGEGACFGDSGGPAFGVDPRAGLKLFAVASAVTSGTNDCHNNSIYTRVDRHANWILNTVR